MLIVSVVEPEPVTDAGLNTKLIPADPEADRSTVPANPFVVLTLTWVLPDTPAGIVTNDGLVEIAKSGGSVTVTLTVLEWEKLPLVPVTVTVYSPVDVSTQESLELPDATLEESATLVGLSEQLSPEGVEACVRPTVPANPLRAETVIVEDPFVPAMMLIEFGFAERLKSEFEMVTVTITLAV